jgi:hypothetical protein
MSDIPELPDFLNRRLNGIKPELFVERKPRAPRKSKVERRNVYLLGKRRFADGFHTASLLEAGNKWARIQIGGNTARVPVEVWNKAEPSATG